MARFDPIGGSATVRIVNLTPPSRSGAVANFDGLVALFTDAWMPPRANGSREAWAPIHVNVLPQQLPNPLEGSRVRTRVSTTVSNCASGCRLMWRQKVIAQTTASAPTLMSGTIAPIVDSYYDGGGSVLPRNVATDAQRGGTGFSFIAALSTSASPMSAPR